MQALKSKPLLMIEKVDELITKALGQKKRWVGMYLFVQDIDLAVKSMLSTDREFNLSIQLIDRMMSSYVNAGYAKDYLFSLDD